MTEDKAKKKICPQTLTRSGAGPANCVASDCMAWHWTQWERNPDGSNGAPASGYCALTDHQWAWAI